MRTRQWVLGLVGLLVVVVLPLAGHWVRQRRTSACALDGGKIEPIFRVRVVDDQGISREFCCTRCAELWLEHQGKEPQAVYVTDEASGQEIDAASAWLVRSQVVTNAPTGNRTHAFGTEEEARRHAERFRGRILSGTEWPFRGTP
jgi:hypothetical protein